MRKIGSELSEKLHYAKPPRITKGRANHADIELGRRLRAARLMTGLSQEKVAEAVGLTFQQIQKYEAGMNRVSAATRLVQFCYLYRKSYAYFLDNLNPEMKSEAFLYDNSSVYEDIAKYKKLISVFRKLPDDETRNSVVRFAEHLDSISQKFYEGA